MLTFEQKLRNYSEIALNIGLGLKPGQRLLISCPVEAAPLARMVTEAAYRLETRLVEVLWEDDAVLLSRFQHSRHNNFDEVPHWHSRIHLEHAQRGDPILSIRASNPQLLQGQDPEKVRACNLAFSQSRARYLQEVYNNTFAWSILGVPTQGWAAAVFPDVSASQQQDRLWDAIFAATRADQENALQLWQDHIQNLQQQANLLNARKYTALHFKSPQTDLTIGLPEGHSWETAQHRTTRGALFFANIPSEEVFTLPHREQVDGRVSSTRPLVHQGQLIRNFTVQFKAGKAVHVQAEEGEAALKHLLSTDEGSAFLGEVALVSASSPIQQSGIFFYSTLFDENAASHLAFGQAYPGSLQGGLDMDRATFAAHGGNNSLIHVDFMVGSSDMDVDGILPDGTHEPVMHHGEFVLQNKA
ncbi:aminopeptidase [Deinococcus roseus]|uniref:Aminopeptidase n=1 Tax=Deinococcus roseus TaxID=392414 RepID=A0ABQ2CYT7_9DEIO|nr:aminopeptidase [Deinococcus roseus]GGJ27182.1 aminopeptidase [Deinococcus roseus]